MARKNATETPAATQPGVPQECRCGCGEEVIRLFRQGHDQKLVSNLASDVVHQDVWEGRCMGILKQADLKLDQQEKINKVAAYVGAKLSEALAAKFENAAQRQWEKQKNRGAREAAKAERASAKASKPAKAKKETVSAAKAPVAAERATVVATATNDDVDADEATMPALGAAVKVRLPQGRGFTTKEATVTGMNQSGKVTAVEYTGRNGKPVRKENSEGFEVVND
jgi:ATPase subunit of ABC transporter with duplicated ATPase domains